MPEPEYRIVDAEVWHTVGESVCEKIRSIGENLEAAQQYLGKYYPLPERLDDEDE